MKELSLHLLDVAKNSVAAGATWVDISLDEDKDGRLTIVISDNGRGMSPEFLAQVTDPFTCARLSRRGCKTAGDRPLGGPQPGLFLCAVR